MTIADRVNAEQVHQRFLLLLDQLSSTKPNREMFDNIVSFSRKIIPLIDKGSEGNEEALREAERYIRQMEAVYHATPTKMRNAVKGTPSFSKANSSEIVPLLQAIRPQPNWKRDLAIASGGAVIGGLILYFVLHA